MCQKKWFLQEFLELLHPFHQMVHVEINSEISVDSTILKFIEPYKKNIEKDLYTTFAYSANTLDKKEGELNTAIGNMMADAVFELSNPVFKLQKDENIDFVLLNYGGIRSIISKGNINEKTAYNLMPFENEVVVTKLIGNDIYKLIDYLRIVKRAHPISGIKLELDKNYELIKAKINNKNQNKNHMKKFLYLVMGVLILIFVLWLFPEPTPEYNPKQRKNAGFKRRR